MKLQNAFERMGTCIILLLIIICQTDVYSQTMTTSRSDGVMLLNGKPFFPIGYYAEGYNTLSENNNAANIMSAAGFKIMFTEHDIQITESEFSSFLDNSASKGIYNIISFYQTGSDHDAGLTSFVNTFKNKPSVVAWCIGDDASSLGTEEDLLRKHNLTMSADPNHLTYESFNSAVRNNAIAQVGISASQSYPLVYSTDLMDGNENWQWNHCVEIVNKCTAAGKIPMDNPQTYQHWLSAPGVYPTGADCDVQSYMGIVAGMKGILYYTFRDYNSGSSINQTRADIWNASVRVNTEIQGTLKNALLDGVRTATANTANHVYVGKWVYGSETFVIAVNCARMSRSISIPVTGTTLTKVFSYRIGTLSLSLNTLSGTLGADEVQIYKVTSGPTDAVAPSAPTALISSNITSTTCTVSWTASTDNVGVTGYEVFIDGISAGVATSTSLDVTGLVCAITQSLTVKARDEAGNWSAASAALPVTTAECIPGSEVVVNDNSIRISYTGTWMYSTEPQNIHNDEHYTNTANDFATLSFTGTGISWVGTALSNRGIVDVYIDNVKQGSVDCYAATLTYQKVFYSNTSLSNGPHTIKLVNTGTKNANSAGTYLVLDAFTYSDKLPVAASLPQLRSAHRFAVGVDRTGALTINLSSTYRATVEVADPNGRVVYARSAVHRLTVPASVLKPGIYFVSERQGGAVRCLKAVIHR